MKSPVVDWDYPHQKAIVKYTYHKWQTGTAMLLSFLAKIKMYYVNVVPIQKYINIKKYITGVCTISL